MRIRILSIYFFFSILALIPFERSTVALDTPNLMWIHYQAGQGELNSHTFITDTETTCDIDVRVSVEEGVPGVDSKIRYLDWEVEASHGFIFTRNWSKNYILIDSGRVYTVFTYSGSGIGNQHSGTARSTHCSNYGGTTNPANGRQNKPIEITVRFKAKDSRDRPINISLRFKQDEIDQIRQEYVDLRGSQTRIKPDDTEISIPSRTAFSDSNSYNSGHYGQMIDESLSTKLTHWIEACDKKAKSFSSNLSVNALSVNSGYRNPHHHIYHVCNGRLDQDTTFRSWHQYGVALDVATVDIDGLGGVQQSIDGKYMANAAMEYANASWTKHDYRSHVHAQWANRDSTSSLSINDSESDTTSNVVDNSPDCDYCTTGGCSQCPTTGACGHTYQTSDASSHVWGTPACGNSSHAGYTCQISSDHNTAMSGWSGSFYECRPHTTFPCGHTDPNANSAYHAQPTSCFISGHFVCDSLTHVEEQCTNVSNGVRCTYKFWRCLHPNVPSYGPSHTCDYPVSCGRSACTQTVTSSTQHSATCASGHSYWTCNPSEVYHHITRTCKYSACGKSWERCSTVGGTPICDLPWRKSKGWSCWW